MIRLWIILGILAGILLFLYKWLLKKDQQIDSSEDAEIVVEEEPAPDPGKDRTQWPFAVILGLACIAIVLFLILPRLGLHPLAMIQKFIPMLGALRNLIP